jgi:hypothetical protein
MNCDRFGGYAKLITAYVLRFVFKLKARVDGDKLTRRDLMLQEFDGAKTVWLISIQST